jgi:hypothetical protein
VSEYILITAPRPTVHSAFDDPDSIPVASNMGVDPATGRIILSVPPGVLTDAPGPMYVASVPIPIRCQRHCQWHALQHHALFAFSASVTPQSNWAYHLGTAAIAFLARTRAEAEDTARAYQKAWTRLLTPIRERLASQTEDSLAALLDAARLLPEALEEATGLPLHEALRPLAEARLPSESNPVWDAMATNTPKTHTLPHLDPHGAHPRTLLSVRTFSYGPAVQAIFDTASVLAAKTTPTCDEALLRTSAFKAIWEARSNRIRGPHATPRVSTLHYQAAAAALRAAALPGPDFALLALELGLSTR